MLGGAGFLPSTLRQAIPCGIPRGIDINSFILKVDPFCDPGSLVNHHTLCLRTAGGPQNGGLEKVIPLNFPLKIAIVGIYIFRFLGCNIIS